MSSKHTTSSPTRQQQQLGGLVGGVGIFVLFVSTCLHLGSPWTASPSVGGALVERDGMRFSNANLNETSRCALQNLDGFVKWSVLQVDVIDEEEPIPRDETSVLLCNSARHHAADDDDCLAGIHGILQTTRQKKKKREMCERMTSTNQKMRRIDWIDDQQRIQGKSFRGERWNGGGGLVASTSVPDSLEWRILVHVRLWRVRWPAVQSSTWRGRWAAPSCAIDGSLRAASQQPVTPKWKPVNRRIWLSPIGRQVESGSAGYLQGYSVHARRLITNFPRKNSFFLVLP